jgi:hypothetical protein
MKRVLWQHCTFHAEYGVNRLYLFHLGKLVGDRLPAGFFSLELAPPYAQETSREPNHSLDYVLLG